MERKAIEVFNKIAYNVLSIFYQPFCLPFSFFTEKRRQIRTISNLDQLIKEEQRKVG